MILTQFEVSPHPQFVEEDMQPFFLECLEDVSTWQVFSGGRKRYTLWITTLFQRKKEIIIAVFITFFFNLKEPPTTLEVLTMTWFLEIHISCHGNRFMFNSAREWQTCRKLCWIYDHKAERGVLLIPNCPCYNMYLSQNQRRGLHAYAKCDGSHNIHLLSDRNIDEAF